MKTRWLPVLVVVLLLPPGQEVRSGQTGADKTSGAFGDVGLSCSAADFVVIRGQDADPIQWDDADYTDCDNGACEVECADPCCMACLDPCFVPRCRVFGEFLYLRPGKEVDCGSCPGFRAGFSYKLTKCSDLVATYSHFESDTTNQGSMVAPYAIHSLVAHPGSSVASTDFPTANAQRDVDFQLVDLDFRRPFRCGSQYAVHYFAGVRYCNLEQSFDSVFTDWDMTGTVAAQVDFDGGGIRVGVEGERRLPACRLLVYGRSAASFVGGSFRGRYQQWDSQRGTVVKMGLKEDGLSSILDLELGIGWISCRGRLRATAGYMFSGWFNTVNTDAFVEGVQTDNPASVGDAISFDGLVARAEFRR